MKDQEAAMKQIQQRFNEVYPFLKLEFLNNGDKKTFITKNIVIQFRKNNPAKAPVNISGERTIADIQKDFEAKLNVPVQVFRKTGNVWIETSLTNDWTLEQQNKEGEMLSASSR